MNMHDNSAICGGAPALARVYKALSHPARLSMLHYLTQQESCVCHLTALLRRPQPYVSQQLGVLRDAGLVTDRREGQIIYYRANDPTVSALITSGLALLASQGQSVELPLSSGRVAGCHCPHCEREG